MLQPARTRNETSGKIFEEMIMLYRFLGKVLFGVFLVVISNGCSTAPNPAQAQKQTTASSPTATISPSPEEIIETPEQIVTRFVEIGLKKNLKFEEKEKQVENCCVEALQEDAAPQEANVENLKKQNPARRLISGMGLLFDELKGVKIKCENAENTIVEANLRVKGKNFTDTTYFTLIKENSKWLIKDVSLLEIPKCP